MHKQANQKTPTQLFLQEMEVTSSQVGLTASILLILTILVVTDIELRTQGIYVFGSVAICNYLLLIFLIYLRLRKEKKKC
jgi:hypothetical protein